MSYTVEEEENKDKNKKTIWTVILISIIFVGFGYIYIISKNTKSKAGQTLSNVTTATHSDFTGQTAPVQTAIKSKKIQSQPSYRRGGTINRRRLSSSIGSSDTFYSLTDSNNNKLQKIQGQTSNTSSIGSLDSFKTFTGSNYSDSEPIFL